MEIDGVRQKDKKALILGIYPMLGIGRGGPAIYVENLSKVLSKYMKVLVISPFYEPDKELYVNINKNLSVIFFHVDRDLKGRSKKFLKYAWKLRKEYDLIHFMGYMSAFVFQYLNVFLKKPMVLTAHGYPSLEAIANGRIKPNSIQFKFIRWVEKKAVERADAVIAVDKRIYDWIINELNGNPEKVFHIPNGVDTEKFRPYLNGSKIKSKYHLENKPVILFVKGLSPKNGPEVAVNAMKEIIKVYPKATLLIVGDGPLKGKLLNLTKELELEKNIIFCGMKSNDKVPYYYATSDIVVVPSVHIAKVEEATSLTMLEGMASGKPVVASNIGGLKEIIGGSDNRIGILFEEGNYKDIAEKVINLLGNESIRTKIGKNARKYVETKRNWQLVTRDVEKVYEFALSKHSGESL